MRLYALLMTALITFGLALPACSGDQQGMDEPIEGEEMGAEDGEEEMPAKKMKKKKKKGKKGKKGKKKRKKKK